jgi:hypothetical protein
MVYHIWYIYPYTVYTSTIQNTDGERKGRQVPWSHTPVIRVRAEDIRVQRRDGVVPRLLTFDEVEEAEGEGGA